jgi:hypothetical protein
VRHPYGLTRRDAYRKGIVHTCAIGIVVILVIVILGGAG